MSELSELVAKLERQVREAEEAHRIANGLWDACEVQLDEIRHIPSALSELSWELDGYVANCDYSAVQRAADEIRGATDADRLLPVLRQVLLLRALRDGATLPDPAAIESLPELPAEEVAHGHGRPDRRGNGLRRAGIAELDPHQRAGRGVVHSRANRQ